MKKRYSVFFVSSVEVNRCFLFAAGGWSGSISCVCRRWCALGVPNEYTLYINRARMHAYMLAHPCSFVPSVVALSPA